MTTDWEVWLGFVVDLSINHHRCTYQFNTKSISRKSNPLLQHTHTCYLHFVYEFQLEIYGFNLGWESANWQYLGTRETYWAVYTQHPYLWLIVSLYIRFRFRGVFCLFSQHIRQEIYVLYCSLRLAS